MMNKHLLWVGLAIAVAWYWYKTKKGGVTLDIIPGEITVGGVPAGGVTPKTNDSRNGTFSARLSPPSAGLPPPRTATNSGDAPVSTVIAPTKNWWGI